MKKIMYLVLISFFTVGTVISIFSYQKLSSGIEKSELNLNKKQVSATSKDPLPAADWYQYDFDTLIDKVDLIAFVTVDKNEKKDDGGLPATLSTLKVTEVLYGSAPDSIILDQTNNIVEPGKSYLLFLNKNGDYYYELSEDSVVVEFKNQYKVQIDGIEGIYKKQDLTQKLNAEIKASLNKK